MTDYFSARVKIAHRYVLIVKKKKKKKSAITGTSAILFSVLNAVIHIQLKVQRLKLYRNVKLISRYRTCNVKPRVQVNSPDR